jgi:hypothetical protein
LKIEYLLIYREFILVELVDFDELTASISTAVSAAPTKFRATSTAFANENIMPKINQNL